MRTSVVKAVSAPGAVVSGPAIVAGGYGIGGGAGVIVGGGGGTYEISNKTKISNKLVFYELTLITYIKFCTLL